MNLYREMRKPTTCVFFTFNFYFVPLLSVQELYKSLYCPSNQKGVRTGILTPAANSILCLTPAIVTKEYK